MGLGFEGGLFRVEASPEMSWFLSGTGAAD